MSADALASVVRAHFPVDLVDAVERVAAARGKREQQTHFRLAGLMFFAELAEVAGGVTDDGLADGRHDARATMQAYLEPSAELRRGQTEHLIAQAVQFYYSRLLKAGTYAGASCHRMASSAAYVLEQLHLTTSGSSRYPEFRSSLFRVVRPASHGPSLAELHLPGFDASDGRVDERRCLDAVRERLLADLDLHVRLRAACEELGRRGKVGAVATLAARQIVTCLSEMQSAMSTDRRDVWLAGQADEAAPLASAELWDDAGLPADLVARWWPGGLDLKRAQLGKFLLGCWGASPCAFLDAAGVVTDVTGMNRSSVERLTVNPTVFTMGDKLAIGSASVIAAFKVRANKATLQCIRSGEVLRGRVADQAMSAWGTATEASASRGHAHALVEGDEARAVATAMSAYADLAAASRKFDPPCRRTRRLFVFPAPTAKLDPVMRVPSTLTFRHHPDELLGRVTFPAIRKSVLNARFVERGSVAATAVDSGNTPDTLLSDYLRTPDTRSRLSAPSQFLQLSLEALIASELPPGAQTGADPSLLAFMDRTARASGLAASFGLTGRRRTPPGGGAPPVPPPPAALEALHLHARAVREAADELDPAVWEARCSEVWLVCTALERMLQANGFGEAVKEAGRVADERLASGELTLPPVGFA